MKSPKLVPGAFLRSSALSRGQELGGAVTGLTGASAGEAPRNFSKSAQRSAAFKGTSQEQVTDTTARLLVPTLVLRS